MLKEQDTVTLLAQRNKVWRKGGWKGGKRERGEEKEEGRGKLENGGGEKMMEKCGRG